MIDDMKCPHCHSEDFILHCNLSAIEYQGVNESKGEYIYECEMCHKRFYVYEETKAIRRIVAKTVEELRTKEEEE